MTTAKFVQPDVTLQSPSAYKSNIDASIAVMANVAGHYAPHAHDTPALTVLIDAGRMMYNGTLVSNAQQTATISAADATNPRIDRITISETTGVYTVTAGTAAVSPAAPSIPSGQLPVCQVSVPANDTTISNSQITDERTQLIMPATFGWSLNGGEYADKTLSIGAQTTSAGQVAFSPSGLTMYLMGTGADTIYQYTLTTAWDISTGSYASKSLSVTAQEGNPYAVAFSSDGTKLYTCGSTNDTIYQYTLTTAWDISTGSYASKSLSVTAQEGSPRAIVFSTDGTKAYIIGGVNNTIYQYTLSTPWDISTGSYATKSLSVLAQEGSSYGLSLSSNGKKAFIVGSTNNTVYSYTLTTAWDISTGSYNNRSLSVVAQSSFSQSVTFSVDGTKMFISDSGNDRIYHYCTGFLTP